jgi:hypothetical protein
MSERRFNEDEVAAIFKRATEAQQIARRQLTSGEGITIAELEAIGKEVSISPQLIAQAAAALDVRAAITSSRFLEFPIGVGRTVRGESRTLMMIGLVFAGMAGVTLLAKWVTGGVAEVLSGMMMMGGMGVLAFAAGPCASPAGPGSAPTRWKAWLRVSRSSRRPPTPFPTSRAEPCAGPRSALALASSGS